MRTVLIALPFSSMPMIYWRNVMKSASKMASCHLECSEMSSGQSSCRTQKGAPCHYSEQPCLPVKYHCCYSFMCQDHT